MNVTQHARKRMQARAITPEDIEHTVDYGRTYYARGAVIKVIGKREAEQHRHVIDLDHLNGVHVVLSHSGTVITTYRNRRFRTADFRKPRRHANCNRHEGYIWVKQCQRLGL